MSVSAGGKTKVAILGGGVGAISAAYALLSQPGGPDKYEITFYQLGWRLGGKGASGRNQEADRGLRIEEHGLHVWMGCYDNAFRMIKDVYAKCTQHNLTPDSPFPQWDDAFKPHGLVTLFEDIDGEWPQWSVEFPTNSGVPGTGGVLLTPWQYIEMILGWMAGQTDKAPEFAAQFRQAVPTKAPIHVQHVLDKHVPGDGGKTTLHDAHQLARSLSDNVIHHHAHEHHSIIWLLDQFTKDRHKLLGADGEIRSDLRHLWIMLSLGCATIRGLLSSGAIFHGLDPLDKYEFREWLTMNGADKMAVWSAPVKALYDLVFAYRQGKADQPNCAAGGAVRTIMRICWTYKGAYCFKMQAGMGDIVFTPAYELLKHLGARFEYFHKVENLNLSADKNLIERIDLAVQATVTDEQQGKGGYDPLIPVTENGKTLLCWPSEPQYDQLNEGQQLKDQEINLESAWTDWVNPGHRTLTLGTDFDLVICGISVAGLKYCCKDLVAHSADWQRMVNGVETVQTEAVQVWMDHSAAEMGWTHDQRILFGSYLWSGADMSQVEPYEKWPSELGVKNVTYYCRQLEDAEHIPEPSPDPDFPRQQKALVKQHALEFLGQSIAPIWPDAVSSSDPNSINWDWVVDPQNRTGAERFDAQYWRANLDPSERYVLSVKNSTECRMPSDASGFDNLYLAGDWTRNGLNMGCVEAAVISGFQVSRKISGSPEEIVGESDLTIKLPIEKPQGWWARFCHWLRDLFGLK